MTRRAAPDAAAPASAIRLGILIPDIIAFVRIAIDGGFCFGLGCGFGFRLYFGISGFYHLDLGVAVIRLALIIFVIRVS